MLTRSLIVRDDPNKLIWTNLLPLDWFWTGQFFFFWINLI
jgi:hypothetical protein